MIDKTEWKALMKKRYEARKTDDAASSYRHMAQAKVAMELLTNSAEWDLLLRYLQSAREEWYKERTRLLDSTLLTVDPATLAAAREMAIRFDERCRLIDTIMTMPADIMSIGDKAETLVERMEDDANS